MSNEVMQKDRLISSFGRRYGRRLPPNAKRLVKELLPTISITAPESGSLDLQSLFPDAISYQMEIGFGAGEHLAALARTYPDVGFIGCEPFINGVAKLLVEIEEQSLSNIRLFTDDARLLCDVLPDASIDKIHILFPDPWPKLRHHKRRLVSAETLSQLARLQKKGAALQLATDHEDYANWMLEQLLTHPDYTWTAQSKADWQSPPSDWVATRYQHKTSAEGRAPMFFHATRC